jgi:hypothetical protein
MKKLIIAIPFLASLSFAETSTLNLGVDYKLTAVLSDNDAIVPSVGSSLSYYTHQLRPYLTTQLNSQVEAVFRLQSINLWGQETSTGPAGTRFPKADGTPWVENAYLRMPGLAWNRLELTLGRQPLLIGDGTLVSDDNAGMNALRARIALPKGVGLDLFTAKVEEAASGHNDFDLNAAVLALAQGDTRWELAWVQESNGAPSAYALAGTTTAASAIQRTFYDLRIFGDLKDAYYKLELGIQDGAVRQTSGGDIALSGTAQRVEVGAQTDTARFGRFGVWAVYASGTGDDPSTTNEDEAFRATFAKRWDGLRRIGFGQYYAATVSDAHDPSAPFSSESTGLPPGASGIKTIGLGVSTVQKVRWTASLGYYIYDAKRKVAGKNSLGAELDAVLEFRPADVGFRFGAAAFFPGDLYGPSAANVTRLTAETTFHF